MITNLYYKNFKCFKETGDINLSNINLFTGMNGKGKSTIFQSLLMMRQSPEHSRTTTKIIFNGNCVNLGSFNDVKNSDISRESPIDFKFKFENQNDHAYAHYFLIEDEKDELHAIINKIHVWGELNNSTFEYVISRSKDDYLLKGKNIKEKISWNNLLYNYEFAFDKPDLKFIKDVINFSRIHFISADRMGPREYYPKQSFTEFPNVGSKGEFTANILSQKRYDQVDKKLIILREEANTVLSQLEGWLEIIFGGGSIKTKQVEANIVLLEINSEKSKNLFKPPNVGFGYSYALPIIVTGLTAKKNDIIIVENPEAHLHPAAQSQIAKFLAHVSTTGVQVFIESHSEHILNGLRLSVNEKILKQNMLKIKYFSKDENFNIQDIPVNSDGSIEKWPDGFFDQTEKDFEILFGI